MSRELFHEQWAIVGVIDPVDANNADTSTTGIDMSKFDQVCFLVLAGAIAASGTFDVSIEESAAASSGFAAMSPAKAMTQLDANDDNKQAMIHVLAEELSAGKRYIRATMANSAHAQVVAIVALGRGKFKPASDDDLSSVDEIVV